MNRILRSPLGQILIGAPLVAAVILARPHLPGNDDRHDNGCPAGSSLARVALYGQTFEAGFGPTQTPVVIVQHEDRGLSVGNYVPILACVAPYTKVEQDARNNGLSIPPSNWTPPAAGR